MVHGPHSSRPFEEVKDEPVWVSLAEASAFCKARGVRIMTEPEYEQLLNVDAEGDRFKSCACFLELLNIFSF